MRPFYNNVIQTIRKMNKKAYQKPTMRVVELRQKYQILTGSGSRLRTSRTNYGKANDGVTSDINSDGEWEWN